MADFEGQSVLYGQTYETGAKDSSTAAREYQRGQLGTHEGVDQVPVG